MSVLGCRHLHLHYHSHLTQLAHLTQDFIEDDFNLTGLSSLVPFYKEAMEMVLDVEAGKSRTFTLAQSQHILNSAWNVTEEEAHRVPDVSIVESSAELLYGLIHQRYIITRQGLQQMVLALHACTDHSGVRAHSCVIPQFAKYEAGHFGNCPRVYCSQTKLLPCGRSDLPGVDTVKLYCPSCVDMYVPPSSRFQGVDGEHGSGDGSFSACRILTWSTQLVRCLLRYDIPSSVVPNVPISARDSIGRHFHISRLEYSSRNERCNSSWTKRRHYTSHKLDQGVHSQDLRLQSLGKGALGPSNAMAQNATEARSRIGLGRCGQT